MVTKARPIDQYILFWVDNHIESNVTNSSKFEGARAPVSHSWRRQIVSLAIWDHTSVTCHPTQVNIVHLNPRQKPVLDLPTTKGWKAELGDAEMVYLPTDGHQFKHLPDCAQPGVELATC